MKRLDNFTQTIISTFGLLVALITAILPLFTKDFITNLFINEKLATPASFLSFMTGGAIIWQIIEFQPYLQLTFGKFKDRGKGYPEPLIAISTTKITWILIALSIIASLVFFYLSNLNNNIFLEIIQTLSYIVFFLSVITIFAILFSQTRQKFIWQENRDSFSQTVFEALEKHRLVKPWIEIYENRSITQEEAIQEKVIGLGLMKKMTVKTSIQEEEVIKFIVSNDGKEIIKVLKKGK
ncbi:MAG: hypothetical protein PHV63_01140 [Candidatus Daviesbacteria bacterium]|nr:hypothetical protein [Candidatus Daviesbacteria bacterium]